MCKLGAAGVAAAVGCKNVGYENARYVKPQLIGAADNAKFDPTAIPQQPPTAVARAERKANAPLRPDTAVALGDNAVEDAFTEIYDQSGFATNVRTDGGPNPGLSEADRSRMMQAGHERGGMVPKYSPADRDRLIDTARQRYQQALDADPKHKGALVGLARLYALTGDRDRAVAGYTQAVQAYPQDHGLAAKLAGVQVQFGDFAGAEKSARYALSLDPQNRTYQKVLGLTLGHQAKWQEAGETLLAAGMPPADAHYFLARVRLDRGDTDGGRKQLDHALSANPQHEAARQVASQLDAGRPAPALAPTNPVVNVGHSEPR
jgi:tetratricopeptide (TPR) repeat protein